MQEKYDYEFSTNADPAFIKKIKGLVRSYNISDEINYYVSPIGFYLTLIVSSLQQILILPAPQDELEQRFSNVIALILCMTTIISKSTAQVKLREGNKIINEYKSHPENFIHPPQIEGIPVQTSNLQIVVIAANQMTDKVTQPAFIEYSDKADNTFKITFNTLYRAYSVSDDISYYTPLVGYYITLLASCLQQILFQSLSNKEIDPWFGRGIALVMCLTTVISKMSNVVNTRLKTRIKRIWELHKNDFVHTLDLELEEKPVEQNSLVPLVSQVHNNNTFFSSEKKWHMWQEKYIHNRRSII